MASGLYASGALCWSGTIKRKTEGSWTYVGRNAAGSCYQKLRSYYQITGRPCHPDEEEQQKGEMRFFEKIFSLDFELSGLVVVHTASLLVQEHSKSIIRRNFV